MSDKTVTVDREKLEELISAVRTINRGKSHEIKIKGDDEPCYWQRKEWVDWALNAAEEVAKDLKQPIA